MKNLEAKKVFNLPVEFLLGAHNFSQVPSYHYPEVAFIGASNVGKSSLVNAILKQKVAIVSSTPGRTRQLNFFKVGEVFVLVDMPGYGFAKADKKHIEHWQRSALEYLTKRANLKRVFLLIDPIKGLKDSDLEIINIFNALAVSFQIVLTKADKITRDELKTMQEEISGNAKKWPAIYDKIIATSSSRGDGINELQDEILSVL
jgi:GTP-binding protein